MISSSQSPIRKRPGSVYVTRSRTRSYRYVILRYDECYDDGSKQPRTLANLGREEDVDLDKARSLAEVMREFVRKDSSMSLEEFKQSVGLAQPKLRILCSRQFGLRLLVEQAYAELGYKEVLAEIDAESRRRFKLDAAVFGMVLQLIVWPGSKLRAAERLPSIVFFPEGEGLGPQHYYRALDEVGEEKERIEATLQEKLAEHDLSFETKDHDTTSSYFESDYDDVEWKAIAEQPDPDRKVPPVVNDPPLRMRGHSKDKQGNKPQIVVEQVLCAGYVLHHETHPGNTSDSTLLPEAVARLDERGLAKDSVWLADAGMNTKKARADLTANEVEWVMGAGRAKTTVVKEILASGGRFAVSKDDPKLSFRAHRIDDMLYVVRLSQTERKRELSQINRHLQRVRETLAIDDRVKPSLTTGEGHSEKICRLISHKTLKRYVRRRVDDPSRLTVDTKAVKHARTRAGKSVICTSLVDLAPAVVDALYRLHFDIEDSFRTLKTGLELRPIRHRRANRIKAHVIVAVMALNVTRHLERKTGLRLAALRDLFAPLSVQEVELAGRRHWQTVVVTPEQARVFETLGYDLPLSRFEATLEEET